ncbi:MAG TPA: helix-turn-helix transcriptional regulator [Elusimicrobiales bacterium]|nr:helix-turn-helix transcriptional regulator [Elusimicrobiales bacterium]
MSNQSSKHFAALVLAGMKEKGISLRALCRQTGVDPSLMSKILAGKRNPPDADGVLRAVADCLGLDPVELSVAVDRIPPEWRVLGSNPALLEAVRKLFAKGPLPVAAPRAAVAPPRQSPMPEELL